MGANGSTTTSLPTSESNQVNAKKVYDACRSELGLQWGIGEMQGWQPTMEDACLARGSLSEGGQGWADTALFAVFDGHGGSAASQFCAQHLPTAIQKGQASIHAPDLHDAFMKVDQMFASTGNDLPPTAPEHPDHVGSTALACLVQHDIIIVANAGDSRAVLSRNGEAVEMSQDHKPNLPQESDRIKKAGGLVVQRNSGPDLVNGDLAPSRAIGDFRYKKNSHLKASKQIVSCEPDIEFHKRQRSNEFMVIASGGVWDALSSQEVVSEVGRNLEAIHHGDLKPSDVVCKILDRCLAPNADGAKGTDNMTMILVIFDSASQPNDSSLRAKVRSRTDASKREQPQKRAKSLYRRN
mmetsp:Transcript_136631/g.237556  ORF Transcript_136631/g.237556 Transcript_136631/m.237556 type:complete len:353 (-) Transcript_136631:155-1213(-)